MKLDVNEKIYVIYNIWTKTRIKNGKPVQPEKFTIFAIMENKKSKLFMYAVNSKMKATLRELDNKSDYREMFEIHNKFPRNDSYEESLDWLLNRIKYGLELTEKEFKRKNTSVYRFGLLMN